MLHNAGPPFVSKGMVFNITGDVRGTTIRVKQGIVNAQTANQGEKQSGNADTVPLASKGKEATDGK